MGLLLLITLSYSIPSIPRQKTVSQTEWVKTVKNSSNEIRTSSKSFQPGSFSAIEFVHGILSLKNRIQVSFNLSKSFRFTYDLTKFAPAKIFSNDDDYFLS